MIEDSPSLTSPIAPVFCDYLKFTVPTADYYHIVRDLRYLLSEIEGFTVKDEHGWGLNGGRIDHRRAYRVGVFSLSGEVLTKLRECGCFDDLLRLIASYPHNITRLDAALDAYTYSPPILRDVYKRGIQGLIRLTRKLPKIKKILAPGPDGVDTGTIYIGTRKAEVYARVYDKRQERIDRAGYDPGKAWTRYEVQVSGKMSPSLRDVDSPAPLFWNFMSEVLKPPKNVPSWTGQGIGFELPPVVRTDALVEQAFRRLDRCQEFQDIVAHVKSLDHGDFHLKRYLSRLYSSSAGSASTVDSPAS